MTDTTHMTDAGGTDESRIRPGEVQVPLPAAADASLALASDHFAPLDVSHDGLTSRSSASWPASTA